MTKNEKGGTHVQLPSYTFLCSGEPYCASFNAVSMTQAVTPVPQLEMSGLAGSTPFSLNNVCSFSEGRNALVLGSSTASKGMLMAPGMCPEDRPGRGSGAGAGGRPRGRAAAGGGPAAPAGWE